MKSVAVFDNGRDKAYCCYASMKGTVGRIEGTGFEKLSERDQFKLRLL